MTNAADIQIKSAYESQEMTPEQIATDLSFDVVAVKAKLMQVSAKYRKECGMEDLADDKLNFSDDDLRLVNEECLALALNSENEKVRADMCKYIRNDKKGRLEAKTAVAGNNFNIINFNDAIKQAREGARQIHQKFTDVSSTRSVA